MKITKEDKVVEPTPLHHEVGMIYKEYPESEDYFMLVFIAGVPLPYRWICIEDGEQVGSGYESLEQVDINNKEDILVDAELIITE